MIKESAWLRFVDEEVNANWPHNPWLPPTIAAGTKNFGVELVVDGKPVMVGPDPGFGMEQMVSALQTFVREGKHFPPTPGELYKRVADLSADYPEWGAVWAEIHHAMSEVSVYGVLEEGRVVLKEPVPNSLQGEKVHAWSSPLVEELVRMVGWQELCKYDIEQERTMEAQCRNKYESLVARARQDRAWGGIKPAGLARLQGAVARLPIMNATIADAEAVAIGEILKQLSEPEHDGGEYRGGGEQSGRDE